MHNKVFPLRVIALRAFPLPARTCVPSLVVSSRVFPLSATTPPPPTRSGKLWRRPLAAADPRRLTDLTWIPSFHNVYELYMEGAYRTAASFRNSPEANELWLLRLQSLPYPAQVKSIIQQRVRW
jgi:hypothetical protein